MLRVGILGSTGSIGTQTLSVISQLPDVEVTALAAGTNVDLLATQINALNPHIVSVKDQHLATKLGAQFEELDICYGQQGLEEIAAHPRVDLVVVALVGAVGLKPTLQALKAGKRVALANKETLVTGGHLVMKYRDQLIPIDSEHSALWQCLDGKNINEVSKLILTASGGPFFAYSGSLDKVTLAQALKHPNWNMGGKITIDSATMMNKGLEVIEAHWLFDFDYPDIEVIIHPESLIHSLVRFTDGSLLAQLATTDMRLPIQYALTYPQIAQSKVKPLNLWDIKPLTFAKPDNQRFPCLELAYAAGRVGGSMPTVLNAANEVAVQRFMSEEISFTDIWRVVEAAMERHQPINNPDLETILSVDQTVRQESHQWMGNR